MLMSQNRPLPPRRLVAAVLLALGVSSLRPGLTAEMPWRTRYAAAKTEAKKSGRPLLIQFYADWCGPCRQMEQTTLKDKSVVEAAGRYVPIRLNSDREPELARRFRVDALPCTVVVSPAGKVLNRRVGFADAADYRLFLLQAVP